MGFSASSPAGAGGLAIEACGSEAIGLGVEATAGDGACATIGTAPSS